MTKIVLRLITGIGILCLSWLLKVQDDDLRQARAEFERLRSDYQTVEKRANRYEEALTHPKPTDCACIAVNATKPEEGVHVCNGNLPVSFMCECVAGKSVAGMSAICGK